MIHCTKLTTSGKDHSQPKFLKDFCRSFPRLSPLKLCFQVGKKTFQVALWEAFSFPKDELFEEKMMMHNYMNTLEIKEVQNQPPEPQQ